MFVEVTGEKLVGGLFAPTPILNRVNVLFNFEEEDKGTLSFLDVLIRKKCKPIVTNLF